MDRLLTHLEKVIESTSVEEVWALHLAKMAEYGFERLIYGFTRFKTGNNFGSINDMMMLSNHSKEYLDKFVASGLYHHAPMVKWTAENVGVCSWRWVEERAERGLLNAQERAAVDLNMKYGVRAGYSIGFKDLSSRSKGAIGLAAAPDVRQHQVEAIWEKHGREIALINNVTHLKMTSLPYANPRRELTVRQKEALEWVGDGKTTQDIATIMGLTPATVEKHLRLAREALDVETTAQAVLKASVQNQIFVLTA